MQQIKIPSFLANYLTLLGFLCSIQVIQPVPAWSGEIADLDNHSVQTVQFDIPAQPLDSALQSFSAQTDLQVSVDSQWTEGLVSNAVSGQHTTKQALNKMLQHTGLVFQFANEKTITLKPLADHVLTLKATPKQMEEPPAMEMAQNGSESQDSGGGSKKETEGTTRLPPIAVEGATLLDPKGYVENKQSGIAGFNEQTVLETPFAVKVTPWDLFFNQSYNDIAAMDRLDASVTASGAGPGWYANLSIRGLLLNNFNNYRYNGLRMINQQVNGLENKERVEILKGPTALQAGFGSPGGLVNYVTKRPTADSYTAVHFFGTQYGNWRTHVDVSRRTENGKFGIRVNAAWEELKTYVDKVDGDRPFIGIAADWQITPDTIFKFDFEHEQRDQTNQPDLVQSVNGTLHTGFDPKTFIGQEWADYPTYFTLLAGKLEHRINENWSFVTEANWNYLSRDENALFLGNLQTNGDATLFLYASPDQTREPLTVRAMTRGTFSTGFVDHEVAFGYAHHRLKTRWGAGFWGAIGNTNIFNPAVINDPNVTPPNPFITMRIQENSVFAQDILSLGEAWKLHLAGRYVVRDEKSFNNFGARTARFKDNVITPSVALIYKPRPNISTYVSYIEGLEPGGIAPLGTTNQNEQMGAVASSQIELGTKIEFNEFLRGEAALFQISRDAEIVNSANTYVQDGNQIHTGIELSLTGKVTSEWTVFGSLMFLDAELEDMNDPSVERNRPSGVPTHRMAFVTEYAPHAIPGLVFTGNWSRTGSRPVSSANTGEALPDYDIFGLGARYNTQINGTLATLRVIIDNLYDKRHFINIRFGNLTPGPPRTVSTSLSLRF